MIIFGVSLSIILVALVAGYFGARGYQSNAETKIGRTIDHLTYIVMCATTAILLSPEVSNMFNLADAELTVTAILSLTMAEIVTTVKSIAASKDRIIDYIFKR